MRLSRVVQIGAALVVAVGAGPVAADPGETSRVESLSATPGSGGTVKVTGEVTFAGSAAAPITATDPTGDARLQVPGQPAPVPVDGRGADLTSLSIDSQGPATLVLALQVADMPPQFGGTPEAIEYRIRLKTQTASGGPLRSYWVQAIRSSQAHAPGSQGPSFRLLPGGADGGLACLPGGEITFLTGSFSSGKVTIEVPWDAIDVWPGDLVWMWDTSSSCETAPWQCAFSSFSASGTCRVDRLDHVVPAATKDSPYVVPGEISLGIAPAGTPAEQVALTRTVRPTIDGLFSASLLADGLPAGEAVVAAKVCFGPSNCHLASTTVTV